ncbi:hypothetical protein MIR68_010591 [Amoeboaphelidium protococcarum]|nr:hypothetical protein MIR68_010591 [Amoeboaphelidium protococcarum]
MSVSGQNLYGGLLSGINPLKEPLSLLIIQTADNHSVSPFLNGSETDQIADCVGSYTDRHPHWAFCAWADSWISGEFVPRLQDHSGSVDFISFTTLLTDNYGDGSVGTFVSGGYDSIVRLWSLPFQVEPYGKYEPSNVQLAFISAFDDIVYDVEFSLDSSRFGALGALGFKVYSIDGIEVKDYWQKSLSSMLNFDAATSSFDFVKNDPGKILVLFANGSMESMSWHCTDMNQTEVVTTGSSFPLINTIVCLSSNSPCITVHETRKMQFHDIISEQCTFEKMPIWTLSTFWTSRLTTSWWMITALHDSSFRLQDVTIKPR